MNKFLSIVFAIMLTPFICLAHEGHGHTHGFTITHYFVEPEHLVVIFGMITVGIAFFRYFRKKAERSDEG